MGVYDNAIATAQRMIEEKGEACTWTIPAAVEAVDAEKPWDVSVVEDAEPTTYPVNIAFFPMDRQYAELIRLARGSDVVVGSLYGLMGAVTGFTPSPLHTVTRTDGTVLALASADPLAPNGDVVLWTLVFAK